MAVDTLFDSVRVLVQGASTANVAIPQNEGWSIQSTDVVSGSGRVDFSSEISSLVASTAGSLVGAYYGGTVEAVVDMMADWWPSASVLSVAGVDIRVVSSGVLSVPRAAGSGLSPENVTVGTGRVYIAATPALQCSWG